MHDEDKAHLLYMYNGGILAIHVQCMPSLKEQHSGSFTSHLFPINDRETSLFLFKCSTVAITVTLMSLLLLSVMMLTALPSLHQVSTWCGVLVV